MSQPSRIDLPGRESWIDIVVAFQRAIRSFETFVRPVLRREGVADLGVANVLMLLNVGEEARRVSDIVRIEGYCNSNASYALTALHREGLIARSQDPGDKRVRIVFPTERGLLLVKRIKAAARTTGGEIEEAVAIVASFESKLREGVAVERKTRRRRKAEDMPVHLVTDFRVSAPVPEPKVTPSVASVRPKSGFKLPEKLLASS